MNCLNEPKQPSPEDWHFVKELSQPCHRHFNWSRRSVNSEEADLSCGVRIKIDFPDPEHCLETAHEDLNKKISDSGLGINGEYEIIIQKVDTECFESYRIKIKPESCQIQAGDSEGIRRGIYYLEDLLSGADGPFLKLGIIERKPWLKSRISRCFFGPIKRPPFYRDELLDDVDYYPNEYLNKLAHEGINGLWLTVEFKDLCKTSITELAIDAEKRLAKLRRTVEKCLSYGIKTYIFCIEPCSLASDDPILLKNPDLKGAIAGNEKHCFCTSSKIAQKYLYEATNWIFTQVPNLGGMINISFGERPTTCLSGDFGKNCPACSTKTPGEIIVPALTAMEQGMHAAAPDAEFISWFYVPQNGTGLRGDKQILDIAAEFPDNVVLQYNFESGGSKEQLGKMRHAGDYWLSYVGPSDIFSQVSQRVIAGNNKISAKIQVGCSHELATVPFIPVPALLYQKYKSMHQLGVSHVMQCWYFGNYPGIMNKTAGELAFEEFKDTEHDFLLRLAAPEWGEYAQKVVAAWELLAEGYNNYPLGNMFQYYGPMHDGVVWPLYLIPEDKPLAPTWRLDYGNSGDRYGECLGKFSLDEVLTLCQAISEKWNRGARIMQDLRPAFRNNLERLKDIDLIETLGILFESGYNILKFYDLREILLSSTSNEWAIALMQMENIVNKEIKRSSRMIKLCKADSRLGFHSEAEGYKFFPDKLKWRIEQLKNLLEKDFPVVKNKINNKQKPFTAKVTKSYVCNSGKLEKTEDFLWRADYKNGMLKIFVDNSANDIPVDSFFKVFLETNQFYPPLSFTLRGNEETDIPLDTNRETVGFNIVRITGSDSVNAHTGWGKQYPLKARLILGDYNPQAKGKLILYENTLHV